LRTIVETVEREHPRTHARLILDLGEVRGFDYYTGMRVRVWAPGSAAPIARGGRYDHMLARYGADLPATGLAIDLDALDEALIAAELELAEERPIPGLLVALAERPASADARALAVAEVARARAEGLRAWIETGLALDRAQALAERRGATRLTWFQADRGERWRRVDRVWQPEADLADPDRNG
jgi:ATP phosphoribosyltransferase regulatory subunit